jgi:DNA-binding FadR family transcriptional regulator
MIEKAGLNVGDRLPPEVSLAEALGVGRSSIREALNRWEGLGIIRRRRGDGTYLTAPLQAVRGVVPLAVKLEGEALLRLLEVRRTLEADVVRKAAQNASPEQRKSISSLCDVLLKEVYAGRPWRTQDATFHKAVYEASGNPMYGRILAQLDGAIERAPNSPFHREEFGLDSFPHHRVLADAILAGDEKAAVDATLRIVDSVMSEIQRIITAKPADTKD